MTKGMILYSGGFDSVALLHKLIISNDFDELIVLYENSDNLAGEYEKQNAKQIFNDFKKKYARKCNIKLKWVQEDINLNWISNSAYAREVCLLTHLTTILRHGEIINFYLGWHESNIKDLDISKKLINWFDKNSNDKVNINFIENYFNGNTEIQIKASVIEYLLDKELFSLPYSSDETQTVEEFNNRKYWFQNNNKEREVAHALLELQIFNSRDFSKIFKFKTKEEIQSLYNKNRLKKENKK